MAEHGDETVELDALPANALRRIVDMRWPAAWILRR